MSAKERDRFEVFSRVKQKTLLLVEAAEELKLSYRQVKRCWCRFQTDGAAGLVHAARGRASNNRTPDDQRDRIVKLYAEQFADFGPTLASEKLAELHQVSVHPDTLVSILKERHRYKPMRHRKPHRKKRIRRASLGSMVQMDGSHHDWFEGRAAKCVLMVLVDDATGLTAARLYEAEELTSAFDAFGRWCQSHGIPRSVYVDKHSIYRSDSGETTQFGRAMKELGVNLIRANSPQAKGRVERRNRDFQDRLVKELRLRKVRSISQANAVLEEKFLPAFNGKYAIEARSEADLHRQPREGQKLSEVLCVAEPRVVGQDWCVRWKNRWLQIESGQDALGLAGKRVEVRALASGELLLSYEGRRLRWSAVSERPKKGRTIVNNRHHRPGPKHPWNAQAACGGR